MTSGRRRRAVLLWGLLLGTAQVAACTSIDGTSGPRPGPLELKVMTFNVENGGTVVDFDRVVEVIENSDADIVAIEEAQGNLLRLAQAVGWEHADPSTHVMSRFPLLTPPPGGSRYVQVEVRPGSVVAVGNVHLPSMNYGPNRIRDGQPVAQILENERRIRVPAVQPWLDELPSLLDRAVPTFLLGDFNAPSHRDWIEETVGIRPHLAFPVEWPVSRAVEAAGFRDSYREVHPDPVRAPGLTWPAGRPRIEGVWNPGPNAAADRIDLLYTAGPAQSVGSQVLGEGGAPDASGSVDPWPSDHRAVLSTFRVTPAPAPTLVAPERRAIVAGEEVVVRFHVAEGSADGIAVVAEEGTAAAERSVDGAGGEVRFSSAGWGPGRYQVMVTRDGTEVARSPLWVLSENGAPQVRTISRSYQVGEPIEVAWQFAPANRWDWLGVYRRGAAPDVASYLTWRYTEATVEGTAVLGEEAAGPWPLKPGRYTVYLLEDDGYDVLAGGDFRVAA